MALPPPNQTQQQMRQYQDFSTREAIGTAIRAGFLQFQANQIAKSSFLKMIPGAGIVRERAEMKRRELYEKQGRDDQGRKLTKQEFEEREKRRADMGKLAEIHDIIQSWNDKWGNSDEGVAVYFKKDSDILFLFESIEAHVKLIHGFLTGAGSIGTATYGSNQNLSLDDVPDRNTSGDQLEAEELAQEQEREDDQDQLESEERQQGFFTKLFGSLGQGRDRTEEGGLFGFLSNLVSPFLDLMKGGVKGMLKKLLTPLLSILTGSAKAVASSLAPIASFLSPLIVPLIIAGVAAAIGLKTQSDWDEIDRFRTEANERTMGTGFVNKQATDPVSGEALYTTTDENGKNTRILKRSEINMTDEQLRESATVIPLNYRAETINGMETGQAYQPGRSPSSDVAREIIEGKMTVSRGQSILNNSGMSALVSVEKMMARYQNEFRNKVMTSVDGGIDQQRLVDDFNDISEKIRLGIKNYPDIFTPQKQFELMKKYDLFRGVFNLIGMRGPDRAKEYIKAKIDKNFGVGTADFGEGAGADIQAPDDINIPGVGDFRFGSDPFGELEGGWDSRSWYKNPLSTVTDSLEGLMEGGSYKNKGVLTPSIEDIVSPAPPIVPPTPSSSAIPSTSSENAALQSAPSNAVSVNTNTNNVNQSNSAVIASGVSARVERTGIENPIWNGYFATA